MLVKNSYVHCFLILLAVTMQFFVSPKFYGVELRVSASDFFIPLMLVFLFNGFRSYGKSFIEWKVKHMWVWLISLTLLMTVALFQGIIVTGQIQKWGLVNKFSGWFVLLIYFVTGAAMSRFVTDRAETVFIRTMLIVALLIGLAFYWPYLQTIRGEYFDYWRMEGFSNNPNSYGLLLGCVLSLGIARICFKSVFTPNLDILLLGFLGSFIVFSGSRSAWLGTVLALLLLVTIKESLTSGLTYKRIVLTTSLVLVVVYSTISVNQLESSFYEKFYAVENFITEKAHIQNNFDSNQGNSNNSALRNYSYIKRADISEDSGVNHRIAITRAALKNWADYPILGIGLGGFTWSELQYGRTATIHNTALWILTETGLLGLLIFIGFFIVCFRALWRDQKSGQMNTMGLAGFLVLCVFIGASVGMEAMYQRYIWFIIGWALSIRPPSFNR